MPLPPRQAWTLPPGGRKRVSPNSKKVDKEAKGCGKTLSSCPDEGGTCHSCWTEWGAGGGSRGVGGRSGDPYRKNCCTRWAPMLRNVAPPDRCGQEEATGQQRRRHRQDLTLPGTSYVAFSKQSPVSATPASAPALPPSVTSCSRCRRGVPQKRKRGSGTGRKTGSETSCPTGSTWARQSGEEPASPSGAGTPDAGGGGGGPSPDAPSPHVRVPLAPPLPCTSGHPSTWALSPHSPHTGHPAPKPARDLAQQIELGWFVFIVLDGQGQHLQCPATGRVSRALDVAPWVMVVTAVTPTDGNPPRDRPGPRADTRHRHQHTPGNSPTSGPGRATRPGTGKGAGRWAGLARWACRGRWAGPRAGAARLPRSRRGGRSGRAGSAAGSEAPRSALGKEPLR